MKRQWIRRVSVLLVLCLLCNANFTNLYIRVQAVEVQKPAASVDVSGNDIQMPEIDGEPPVEDVFEEMDSTVTDSDVDSETEPDISDDTDGEKEPVAADDTDSATEPDTADEADSATESDSAEDNGSETEVDTERFQTFALTRAATYDLPGTVSEYIQQKSKTSTFYISSEQDFLDAQNLCADPTVAGFKGITIIIASPPTGESWKVQGIDGFAGIGTADCPFRGTLQSSQSGIAIYIDKPLIAYMGNGAQLDNMKIVCDGSNAAIAGNIDGAVTISNVVISGSIGDGSGTVGLIASIMESNSTVNIKNTTLGGAVTISGEIAGGFAGTAGDNVKISQSGVNFTKGSTVTGTEAAGGCFGTLNGSLTYDAATWQSIYPVKVVGTEDSYGGQVVGRITATEGDILEIQGSTLKVNLTGADHCGGIVGYLQSAGEVQIKIPENGLTITGTMSGGGGYCGGVVGRIEAGETADGDSRRAELELKGYTIQMDVIGDWVVGGLVGYLDWAGCIIGDVTVGVVKGGATGGLIGMMNAAAVELQEDITISTKPNGWGNVGLLVGERCEECFIYLATPGLIERTVTTSVTGLEEIGGGGGVFRNHSISGGVLIGDGTMDGLGDVNHTVEKDGSGYYLLKSVIDFECLAIALSTGQANWNYGLYAFEDIDEEDEVSDDCYYNKLRESDFKVTNSVDISYEETGIVTLNCQYRDDGTGEAYAFAGSMIGANSGITITQNSSLKQEWLGLFSTLTGENTFSNLTFKGTVTNAMGVGGIAYQTFGTGLALENITMNKTFSDNTGYIGGVLALESGDNELNLEVNNITLASTINAGNVANYSGFITEMDWVNIDIKNVILGGSVTSSNTGTVGGFLGKEWTLIGGKIQNLTVQSGTTFTSGGTFGGLITVISNDANKKDERFERVVFDTIALKNLTVNVVEKHSRCGLLMQDAQDVVAEIIDYDSSGCVVNNPGDYFDEIAGRTKDSGSHFNYNSGIISLHNRNKMFPDWHYENKVTSLQDMQNKYTAYYYDVFQHLEDENGNVKSNAKIKRVGGVGVIDTPEKFFVWHLVHCANSDPKVTFGEYFDTSDNRVPVGEIDFRFEKTLDVSNLSIYPTSRVKTVTFACQNAATIIFGATEKMADWTLSNNDSASQHYGLQAGLFYNRYDMENANKLNLTISDLTLTGTIANLGTDSGALVVGKNGINGGGNLTNITLDNLRIVGYNQSADAGAALLISQIPDNTVTFSNIRMQNYPNDGTKAASALIGSAGSDSATNLVLRFEQMVIADGKIAATHNGDALSHASFLYSYNYIDDALRNKGSGIYWFSEADATGGIVTYGSELTEDTEFRDNSKSVLETMDISPADYIPYVYQSKDIEVNPKTGDILKGCGTYEDPYIIENIQQFLTLYRYMNEQGAEGNYQYEEFYRSGEGWKMIKPGDDSTFCAEKHEVSLSSNGTYEGIGEEDMMTFGDDGFPTPEQLSGAYYQLGADIDLSAIGSATYKIIAEEFIGFGTETRPFTGVWHGNGYTVTLPEKKDKTYSNYGFIQYARGAVVKDINIMAGNTDLTKAPTITGAAGSVIAIILGGDNIIDDVTIQMAFKVADENTPVGGYVGVIKKGGLILRDVVDSDLQRFVVDRSYSETGAVGAVVGKVEDGFAVYEGAASDPVLWMNDSMINRYKRVPSYSILNAGVLGSGGVSVSEPVAKGDGLYDIKVVIPNATGLQLMSMALNADALNIRPSNDEQYSVCGYTEQSRSRKARYDNLGTDNSGNADYRAAVKYDNANGYNDNADKAYAYPYLYDLLGIADDGYLKYLLEADGQIYTVLNTSKPFETTAGTEAYRITWELAQNSELDMAQFGNAFRGIGAVYQTGNGNGGTFHGSFDGNGSAIHVQMTRSVLRADAENETLTRVGLFNTIYGSDASMYSVPADFCEPEIPGTETDTAEDLVNCFEIKDFTLYGQIRGLNINVVAGGVVACMDTANYIFDDIKLGGSQPLIIGDADDSMSKTVNAGGVVGWLDGKSHVLIRDCSFTGTEANQSRIYGFKNVGGLIGNLGNSKSNAPVLKIETATMEYLRVRSWYSNGGYAGGLVGDVRSGKVMVVGTENAPVSVAHSSMTGQYAGGLVGRNAGEKLLVRYVECTDSAIGTEKAVNSAGGIIGRNRGNVAISDGSCVGLTLQTYANAGGVVGCNMAESEGSAGQNTYDISITNFEVENLRIEEQDAFNGYPEGLGGVVGRNIYRLNIENVQVSGTKTDDVYHFRILGTEQNRNAVQGVGGVVGYHYTENASLTLKDCTVDTLEMSTAVLISKGTTAQDIGVGGLVGIVGAPVTIDSTEGVTVTNCDISVPMGMDSVTDEVMAAGGCFGYVSYRDSKMYGSLSGGSTNNMRLISQGNTIRGKNAGGVMGRSEKAFMDLKGVQVVGNAITSDEMAGGVAGYLEPYNASSPISQGSLEGKQGYTHMENISVENNIIVANTAGGLLGGLGASSALSGSIFDASLTGNVIAAEVSGDIATANPAVGGILGRAIQTDSVINTSFHCDGIYIAGTNQIGVRKNSTSKVQLVLLNAGKYQLADFSMPKAGESNATNILALDTLEQQFGCYVGTFVGIWEATNLQMYVTDSQQEHGKFKFPVVNTNPPVVDVGRTPAQDGDAYRSYCHIIYGAENTKAASESQNLADMKEQVDFALGTYAGTETAGEILPLLRASAEALDFFALSYRDSYRFPGTDLSIAFPMVVYRVQDGDLQEVMENVTDIMTNVAGCSASDMRILSIQCTPMMYDGSKFTESGTASISAKVTDGIATYQMVGYDGLQDDNLTYTRVTFTYNNCGRRETFVVPVFVEEPILYSVHSKLMEGRVSEVSTIRDNGTPEEMNQIAMANDSDYTLLLEYTYGQAREQMVKGVSTDKQLYMTRDDSPIPWKMGTQILLIDVTGGNKPYYYTVADQETEYIKFTDFKDSSGNSYAPPSINSLENEGEEEGEEGKQIYTDLNNHSLTNTGVERFLLTVLNEEAENDLFVLHAGLSIADESLASRFYLEEGHAEETTWRILAIPGLEVGFVTANSSTTIDGSISKTDQLAVKATFELYAKDNLYWVEQAREGSTVIDSSNSSKYLELALYLRDEKGNRVTLPAGTNFSYNEAVAWGGTNYSENRVVADSSIVYYYKDIRNLFGLDDSQYKIENITQNITVPVEFVLDFSGADMSGILEDHYVVCLELLRTGNRDYPMGNGNTVDRVQEQVEANATREMGFALRANHMESLAINTYPRSADVDEISGQIMFDFSENLEIANAAEKEILLEKWAGMKYTVVYQMYQKIVTENGTTYVPYEGDDIIVSATDHNGLEKGQVPNRQTGNVDPLAITYTLGKDLIRTGNSEDGVTAVEGVVSFPCKISIATRDLLAADGVKNLTNYKLVATLTVKDAGVTEEALVGTTDFFVFTVTKLKFDL